MRRSRTAQFSVLFFLIFASILLAGCSTARSSSAWFWMRDISMRDPESSFDYTGDVVARVEPGVPVSQTMVSRRSDLDSVQLWLRKDSPKALDADILIVTLYHANESSTPLASVTIPYRTLAKSYPVEVRFPSQPDPPNQSYLIRLETQGGPLAVYGRNENAYPEGDLSIGEVNQQADLAFRLSYKYGFSAVKEDLLRTLSGAWLTLPLVLLLLVPGCLALWALGGDPSKSGWDWGQRFGLALGLSLGITPLVMIWTSASGLSWGQSGVRIGYICAAVALGLTVAWRLRGGWRLPKPDRIDLALLVIFLFALGLRLSTVRDLAVPAWVDPVHHTTIARLIVEQGAYPESYDPFVSATTASYHPGFHATVAALHWLTGLELDRAMLLLGQILNALIVPAIYLLTTSLTRSRKAGLFSALIAGFMTPMPAYYTSWGRYTQLAGLLALPAAAALMIQLLEQKALFTFPKEKKDPGPAEEKNGQAHAVNPIRGSADGIKLTILAGIAAAGLFIIHYRAAGFWALLMIAYFAAEIARTLDKKPLWQTLPRSFFWVLAAACAAILISLPWWSDLIQTMLIPRLARPPVPPQPFKIDWGYLTPAYGRAALWLAAAGLICSILRLQFFGPALVLWVGLLFLAANQGPIHFPGAGMINKSSVEIMLFMPIAVLGGYALGGAAELLQLAARRLTRAPGKLIVNVLIGLGMLAVIFLGSAKLLPIINPTTLLFREADRNALKWIEENTPPQATFLINPFLWGYGIYAGHDGGYWITPMAGRATMPPNLLYEMGSPQQVSRVNQISQKTLDLADNPLGLKQLMEKESICYIYLGRRGGAISPQKLSESQLFHTLYSQDGTWVFRSRSTECGTDLP